jgi:hypothetical protein
MSPKPRPSRVSFASNDIVLTVLALFISLKYHMLCMDVIGNDYLEFFQAPIPAGNPPTSAIPRTAGVPPRSNIELTQLTALNPHPTADSQEVPVSYQDALTHERRQRSAAAQTEAERLAIEAMLVARSVKKNIHVNLAARKDGRLAPAVFPPSSKSITLTPTQDHTSLSGAPSSTAPTLSAASIGGSASPLAPLLPPAMDPIVLLGRFFGETSGGLAALAGGRRGSDGGRRSTVRDQDNDSQPTQPPQVCGHVRTRTCTQPIAALQPGEDGGVGT